MGKENKTEFALQAFISELKVCTNSGLPCFEQPDLVPIKYSNSPNILRLNGYDFQNNYKLNTAVASMRRTEALETVKFYQILSIFIFFIRLIILEDFIRLISYNGPCVRLGCSFFLATALLKIKKICFNLKC